jgi:RNA polymerase sigma-70 factor (ECF subfamily)
VVEALSFEEAEPVYNEAIANLSFEELVQVIQKLPPAYRLVFNLFVIEDMKHHEIAEQLNISVGASKSNLAKARKKLISLLPKSYKMGKTGEK